MKGQTKILVRLIATALVLSLFALTSLSSLALADASIINNSGSTYLATTNGNVTIGAVNGSSRLFVSGGAILQNISTAPYVVGNITDSTLLDGVRGIAVQGQYVYAAGYNSNTFAVIDVSDPARPAITGSISLTKPDTIQVAGRYAYVTSNSSEPFTVIDISNPSNPIIVGAINTTLDSKKILEYGLYVSGSYAYTSALNASHVSVIDISKPHAPSVAGKSYVSPVLAGVSSVYSTGRLLYVTSESNASLVVLNLSDTIPPIDTDSFRPDVFGNVSSTTQLNGSQNIQVSGAYAYVPARENDMLTIVDISNATKPTIAGTVTDTRLDGAYNVRVLGKYAYVTSQHNQSLTIVDVSNVSSPNILTSLTDARLNGSYGLAISGQSVGGSTSGDTSLMSPTATGALFNEWTTPTNAYSNDDSFAQSTGELDQDYLNFSLNVPAGVTIKGIDVRIAALESTICDQQNDCQISVVLSGNSGASYPTPPQSISNTDLTETETIFTLGGPLDTWGTTWSSGNFSNSNFSLLIQGFANGAGRVLYVDHIQVSVYYAIIDSGQGPGSVTGAYAYVSSPNTDTLSVVKLPSFESPSASIGAFETSSLTADSAATGDVYVGNGIIAGGINSYGPVSTTGPRITQAPSSPGVVGYVSDSRLSSARGIHVSGKYAYVASFGNDSLNIVDLSVLSAPSMVSSVTDARLGGATDVYAAGRYAYVASNTNDSLTVVDISNASSPAITGSITDIRMDGANDVFVQGRYAFVTSNTNDSLTVVDVSNPYMPVITGTITNVRLDNAQGLYVQGRYAYVAAQNNDSISIVDVSNPASLSVTGSLTNGTFLESATGVYVSGPYAYVVRTATPGLTIINISDPTKPTIMGYFTNSSIFSGANDVYVSGAYAYVTSSSNNSLAIVDLTNATKPKIVRYINSSAYLSGAYDVYVQGKYAYVTAQTGGGVAVVDITGIDSASLEIGSLEAGSLSVAGNAVVYDDLYAGSIYANGIYTADNISVFSHVGVGIANLTPNYALNVNGQVNATAYIANGSDYAEILPKLDENEVIEPGDVVAVVGGKVTKAPVADALYMVVTNTAGVIGNGGRDGVPVAFVGRVRVKVDGYVNEGDYVLSDGTNVYAKPKKYVTFDEFKKKVIGIALESGSGYVMTAVGVK